LVDSDLATPREASPTPEGLGVRASVRRSERGPRWLVFGLGLVLSTAMLARSQVGGDQLDMLARGWLFAHGQWVQFGTTTSADGKSPGGLTSLLTGVPLLVWRDYRAPAVLILLAHILAYLLLDRTLRSTVGPRARLLFAVLYWLNPWRAYHSAFLWDPNWTFLFGAVQMWAAFRQRRRPSFAVTLVHVLALGAFLQLNTAFVVLVAAAAVLVMRGLYRPSWPAVAVGAGLNLLTLVPWVQAVAANPALMPGRHGFILRGLVFVFPLVRGIGFWLRYPTLAYAGDMAAFDFSALLGRDDRLIGPALETAVLALAVASALASLAAAAWMWRRFRRRRRWRWEPAAGRLWVVGYVESTFIGAVVAFALSPTTIMHWQAFSILHAAVLPVVMWAEVVLRARKGRAAPRIARAYAAALALVLVCMTLGAPMYRRGGRAPIEKALREDHPMYRDLGLLACCSVVVDPARDWTPDVFRPDPSQGR
jgi:hypothetical protein